MGFSGGSDNKDLPAMQETQVQSLGWEDPLEKGMATHSSMCLFHRQSSLVSYSPWGSKESDMTEQLTHTGFIMLLHYGDLLKI